MQDDVGAARHAGVERDPAGVAAHHLDHHDALCASAVVCRRSIASAANDTAVSKPKHVVVPTMSLSMVLGTPTIGNALQVELVGDRQRAVAADDDQGVQPHLVEGLDHTIRVVRLPVGGVGRVLERVAVVGRAEDRATETENAGDILRRERRGSATGPAAVEAVLETDDFDLGVGSGLDDGADDRVEPGGVAAAGQDADFPNCTTCVPDYSIRVCSPDAP